MSKYESIANKISKYLKYNFRFYDTSKQGVGAGLIHFANVFLSKQNKDPCIW